MMKNLFVCHTQANLILAIGLSKGRFYSCHNELILYKDFNLSTELLNKLKLIFARVLCFNGTYPDVNKSWRSKLKRYPSEFSQINHFMNIKGYDRVFQVCDEALPEIYILKKSRKLNPSTKFIWLEDGSHPYFVNGIQNTGFNSNIIAKSIRKLIFKYFFGMGKSYDFEGSFMGANKNLKSVYLTFPGKERNVYSNKKKEGITDDEYRLGIELLYNGHSILLSENSVVIVLDKLDCYKDINCIKYLMNSISIWCSKNNKTLYYKLHPREEISLNELEGINALDKNLGIENYYASNLKRGITILGVKSSGLQASRKLGFKTISTMKLVGEDENNVSNFYNKINIAVPSTYQDLFSQIKNLKK